MATWCPGKHNFALYLDCKECEDRICEAFFCLVVGSRSFDDYDFLAAKLDRLLKRQQKVVIVSGGAEGADSLAKRYAKEKGITYVEFPAEWDRYGKRAGYVRNRKMHEYISKMKKRGCVAFWDGESAGTKQNFALAKEFGNPCRVIDI
jgi:hypothetical protein